MTHLQQNFKRNHRALGTIGEQLALKYLLNKGYSFILANFQILGGEIDLITQKNGIIHFVEVKTRWSSNFGPAQEALTYSKKQKILHTICTYLRKENLNQNWRCDLVTIDFISRSKANIQHIKNIFYE